MNIITDKIVKSMDTKIKNPIRDTIISRIGMNEYIRINHIIESEYRHHMFDIGMRIQEIVRTKIIYGMET